VSFAVNMRDDFTLTDIISLVSEYCKQGTEMRQLVCMSADVYCQITNNFYLRNNIILYSNGKKGKGANCQRDRERECTRDRELLKMELASVVKQPLEEGLTILGFLENLT
jgi:hypothetical protein